MDIDSYWYKIEEEKTDLENVQGFLNILPSKLMQIISLDTSNFVEIYLTDDENLQIKKLLFSAFDEAVEVLRRDTSWATRESHKIFLSRRLHLIGFTDNALKLKFTVLNDLWRRIITAIDGAGSNIIDFANNDIVKLISKFLAFLNSMLGSLTKLFPGVDPIKEIKEVIESYLTIAEK